MVNGKKIVAVLPAYNAAKTLEMTFREIPMDVVDEIVLVDDHSRDETTALAHQLGIHHVIRHEQNTGYGGNQKTCYAKALEIGADVVIMVHPDYQYTPKLIPVMAWIIANDVYPVVLASRILGNGALKGGMPIYKYIANRALTLIQNILVSQKLSEYHTGYRAFSADVLRAIKLDQNSDDFVFDNQMLSQIIMKDFPIGEVTCPTKYFEEASSINLRRSIIYGFGVLWTSVQHRLHRLGIRNGRY
ncbi:MAG: glycosyltransferase family 2 protein [Ignavibacteriae bacterium]|jgi:glycosyltransferase involved in cell wall biosynthesis|nr:MAG: glycosyltransferase family 2 protein [Ignavibacteriota bacterium]